MRMVDFYGHPSLVALKSDQGYYCYNWWESKIVAVVLFTDTKTARTWLKKANIEAANSNWRLQEIAASLTQIRSHPPVMRATINPSTDVADLQRIMSKSFWKDW